VLDMDTPDQHTLYSIRCQVPLMYTSDEDTLWPPAVGVCGKRLVDHPSHVLYGGLLCLLTGLIRHGPAPARRVPA
jgi:hypothetical protein